MSVVNPEAQAIIRPARRLESFTANVVIDETASDDLEITQHPVQEGAAITDHAYKKPVNLNISMIFSDETQPLAEIYANLLKLQASRVPFDVVTGKRIYKNMLMKSLGNTTDDKTENILSVTCSLQEIILVKVETTSVPPRARQKMSGKTGATKNAGAKKAVAAKPSAAAKVETSNLRDLLGAGPKIPIPSPF